MSQNLKVNVLQKVYDDYHYILLNFPTNKFLKYVLTEEYKYVWVKRHWLTTEYREEWREYNLPLNDKGFQIKVLAKFVQFDFIMPTTDFIKIYDKLPPGLHIIQMNKIPPPWMDLNKLNDSKSKYDILKKECDFLYELDISYPTDYSEFISTDRGFLEKLYANPEINWDKLP